MQKHVRLSPTPILDDTLSNLSLEAYYQQMQNQIHSLLQEANEVLGDGGVAVETSLGAETPPLAISEHDEIPTVRSRPRLKPHIPPRIQVFLGLCILQIPEDLLQSSTRMISPYCLKRRLYKSSSSRSQPVFDPDLIHYRTYIVNM
jgi:hypothetical protein